MPQYSKHKLDALIDDITRVIISSQRSNNIRAVLILTHDRSHAMKFLHQVLVDLGQPLYHFSFSSRKVWNHDTVEWEEIGNSNNSTNIYDLLLPTTEIKDGGVVILEDVVPYLRDDFGNLLARDLLRTMLSTQAHRNGLVLVFLEPPESENYLPSILADRFVRLNVPYPRIDELNMVAREEIAKIVSTTGEHLETTIINKAARLLGTELVGLTFSAARDAVRDALAPDPFDFDSACQRLRKGKSQHLSRLLAMRVLDSQDEEYPVGLTYLIDYIVQQSPKMRLYGPGRAKGVLFVGPPGTGKTMVAKAIGQIVGLPVVEFKISSVMKSYVGETERLITRAFTTLEAMSPNVVFIDEIEKVFGASNELDGGTMMRATSIILQWLSDNHNPNYTVATCNSIKRMGEIGKTMTRSERFDQAFFVDVPNLEARQQMLELWLANHMPDPTSAATEIAKLTEKFSGADIRSLVKHAIAQAEHNNKKLTLTLLKNEAKKKRMRAIALYDEFSELRRWGRTHCELAGPVDN